MEAVVSAIHRVYLEPNWPLPLVPVQVQF